MTNFEENIRRGMTHEKFVKIRDHKYGDGGNFFNYTYGDVASFLTWNRDENDENKVKELRKNDFTKGKNVNDGSIHDWDQEKLKIITTDIVFIAENMSRDGKPLTSTIPGSSPEDFWFQNARRDKYIIKTFFNTEAEGAYFTDIIKTDKRLLNKVGKPAKGEEVRRIFKSESEIQEDHFRLFNDELKFIGAVKPLLIVFGNDAEAILQLGLDKGFLKIDSFRDNKYVKIHHYSYRGSYEDYKDKVRGQISEYITIPEKKFPINLWD